jgi:Asp-tRNA(Asn)/Glu-tRNA(Gln) amidotransferase A subunit family amidase
MASELFALDAQAMRAGLASGRFESRALIESCLARIAARDGKVHAFARLSPAARSDASASDRRRERRALEGIPIGVKDIIDTAGLGTEYNSAIYAGHVPAHDADVVVRLREAGAVIIGKCHTTEFANMHPSPARNPHGLAHTPGGSSSGSAAAVAAGMVPLALGTQTGGSVIRPGSFCGLFAFKSSWGRTNIHGVHELARSFDTIGWYGRSARDLELLAPVLLNTHRPVRLSRSPRFVRLATPYDRMAEKAMLRACDVLADALAERGAKVVKRGLPALFREARDRHRVINSTEASRSFGRYARETPKKLSAHLRGFVAEGRRSEAHYADALAYASRARVAFDAAFGDDDVFIVPSAPGEAPRGIAWTGDAVFNSWLSLLQVPCVTLPFACGPRGLPLGVQLVGRYGQDERLLAIARWTAERLDIRAPIAT